MLVYQICAGVITAGIIALIIYLIRFLIQARQTAIAVELLTLNANEQVERTGRALEVIEHISHLLTGTFGKILGAGIAASKLYKKHKEK